MSKDYLMKILDFQLILCFKEKIANDNCRSSANQICQMESLLKNSGDFTDVEVSTGIIHLATIYKHINQAPDVHYAIHALIEFHKQYLSNLNSSKHKNVIAYSLYKALKMIRDGELFTFEQRKHVEQYLAGQMNAAAYRGYSDYESPQPRRVLPARLLLSRVRINRSDDVSTSYKKLKP